jgi:hypothetical protein
VWAAPEVDRPGFFPRYLRTFAVLLLLGLIVVVTGAASTAAGTAASLGYGGFPARVVSIASGQVSTRSMMLGGAISALGSQILLTVARIVVAHQLRHTQPVAGLLGVVLWLLAWAGASGDSHRRRDQCRRRSWPTLLASQPLPIVAAADRRAD